MNVRDTSIFTYTKKKCIFWTKGLVFKFKIGIQLGKLFFNIMSLALYILLISIVYNLYNTQSLSYYKLYVTLTVIQIITTFFTAFVKTIKLQNIKNEIV